MIIKIIKNSFLVSIFILLLAVAFSYYKESNLNKEFQKLREWTEKNKINVNSLKLEEFKIEFDENEWNQLVSKLNNTRYFDRLDEKYVKRFEFGFDPEYARELVEYWRTKFDWKKRVGHLNRFAHYKMRIDDEVTVHYLRKVTNKDAARPVIPLMLLDGWPGSFYGFYRMIDYLEENFRDLSFDIVVASIPGYGYSTPLHKPVDTVDTAQYFDAIMRHIHDENVKYFVHGEDWGSGVATNLAQLFPERVQAIHITLPIISFRLDFFYLVDLFGSFYLPQYFVSSQELETGFYKKYSLSNYFHILINKTAYFHYQATKPDTLAFGFSDSPVSLLTYILDKYSFGSNEFTEICGTRDGQLEKFNRDDLLTIVTIYWMTNSFASSMRIYKSTNALSNQDWHRGFLRRAPVFEVPVAVEYFMNEVFMFPSRLIKNRYRNLKALNIEVQGGHFAGFENPKLSADNLVSFIKTLINSN